MNRYVQFGGNFLDTANIYCFGQSELFIGSWINKLSRDRNNYSWNSLQIYKKILSHVSNNVISIINFAVFNTAWFEGGGEYLDYKGEIEISDVTSNLICFFGIYKLCIHVMKTNGIGLVLWCLTPLSTILQLYRGCQFYWWRKLEFVPANHWQTLSHKAVSSTPSRQWDSNIEL